MLAPSRGKTRVLARSGDEVWRVEELGMMKGEPKYLLAYVLQDPFRTAAAGDRAWIIHEMRYDFKG